MEPNHLKTNEICFELLCRSVQPLETQTLRRAQLRGLLEKEKTIVVTKVFPSIDRKQNLDEIQETLNELYDLLFEKSPSENDCKRARSRLNHVENRISFIPVGEDSEVAKQLELQSLFDLINGQQLIQQDSWIEEVNRPTFSPIMNSTAAAGTSTANNSLGSNGKQAQIFKWGLQFSGLDSKVSAMSFLEQVEDLCISRNVKKADLFRSARDLFTGSALLWYRNVRDEVNNWEELVVLLKRDFLPFDYEYDLLTEIRNRTQGVQENVTTFIIAIEALFKRLGTPRSQYEIVQQVIRNLNPYFADHVATLEIDSLQELRAACRRVQELKFRIEHYKPPPHWSTGT